MEDEVEEREEVEVDDKVLKSLSFFEIEKDFDEERGF